MIRQAYHCDFCGTETPPEGRSVVQVTAGPLRETLPAALDVCQPCGELLVALRHGKALVVTQSTAPALATPSEPPRESASDA